MDAVQFQLAQDWTPRCQNIVDDYDCENDATSRMSFLFSRVNVKKFSLTKGRSDWLRCNDCHGGVSPCLHEPGFLVQGSRAEPTSPSTKQVSAGDIALGVAVGGLAIAGGALLVRELTKER